ncbi:MAG TPA: 3'(2'),5'-bisphosphate nucleotidase CysQ [Saprospiraceae bacterium]|nr:3'(2'),5'-bisphosphate nucleotidase CysQ [Saprospiraceae bacterium]
MTEAILPILEAAGKTIIEVYENESLFKTEYKDDLSPLTEADRRSNRIICDSLAKLFPNIPIISEENKQAAYDERSSYKRLFLVDPLDGTKEFIKRNGEFTINIAYVEEEKVVAGYVYIPVTRETYFAEKFEGAWSMKDGKLINLHSRPFHLMDKSIKVVASRSHRDPRTDKIISLLNEPHIVSIGSALKFIKVAVGEADFYPRLAPTMEWDTAAAQCIVEEAGGSVIRFDNRLPVSYNKVDLLSPYFIAFGRLLDPESLFQLLDTLDQEG